VEPEIIKSGTSKVTKIKKRILNIIYILFGLYFILDLLLFFVATPILKSYLQNKVSVQTHGLFSVDFEKISIEIAGRRLALKNFQLIPDSAVYEKLKKSRKDIPALYKISCNSVELYKLSVYNLFYRNRLKARGLKLVDLVIELQQMPNTRNKNERSRDFIHEDLYPAISKYVSEITIEEIKVINGKFNLDLNKDAKSKTTHIGYVSINMHKFLLNRKEFEQRKHLFFSEDLQINIDEYKISLSDNLHYIYAQDLSISSKESMLTAKNIGITPINLDLEKAKIIDNNYYNIHAPFIEFNHFNLFELYFNKDIEIGKVLIRKPKVNIYNVINKDSVRHGMTKSKEIDLSKLIAGKLNSVFIDTFIIDNGSMNLFVNNVIQKPNYHANSLTVALYKFKLDNLSSNDKSKIFYADDILLNIKDFSSVLPDKVHTLDVSAIDISTFDRNFKARGIKLHANAISRVNPVSLDISVPYIEISNTDFYKLYNQRDFNIQNLSVGNSNFNLNFARKTDVDNGSGKSRNILTLLTSNYLNQLSISNFNLSESQFKITNRVNDSVTYSYKGVASFALSHFFIDEESLLNQKSKLFYSDQFKLKLKDYQQDLKDLVHQLYSKSIEVSTSDSLIDIAGLKIYKNETDSNALNAKTSKWIYDFDLIQVAIKGIDINKAYNDSNLSANSITIFRPYIRIENNQDIRKAKKYSVDTANAIGIIDSIENKHNTIAKAGSIADLMSLYFARIHLNKINIDNADFALYDVDSIQNKSIASRGHVSARISEFQLFPGDSVNPGISYTKDIAFRITDYFNKIFDKKYHLKIDEARYSSTDSSFFATKIKCEPDSAYAKLMNYRTLLTFSSPGIQTYSTDISKYLNFNILDLGYIHITNPKINVKSFQNQDTLILDRNENKKENVFPFDKIKCSGLNIDKGSLNIEVFDNGIEKTKIHSNLKIYSGPFEIDSGTMKNQDDFINGLQATIKFPDIDYHRVDSSTIATLKLLELNTLSKTIKGKNLHYQLANSNKNSDKKYALSEINLPDFIISGFGFDKFLLHKNIIAKSFKIKKPEFSIIANAKDTTSKSFRLDSIDLYGKIKKNIENLNFDTIGIENAGIKILSGKSNSEPKELNKLYVDLYGFKLDSINTNRSKILNSDDVKARIYDYEQNFSNDLYHLYFKEFGFSTGHHSAYARGIYLNPQRERDEYANLRQKETSLMYLKVSDVRADGVDIKGFVEKGNINANLVNIDGVQMHTYKNKQFPIDSIIRPFLPHDFILKSSKPIKIDTLNFTNSYFSNEVLQENAREPGFIELSRIKGSIYNLTNSKKAIKNNEITTFVASGYLMDKSLLTTSFHFPLGSPDGSSYLGGVLDTFDVRELNPLLENSFFVSVNSGKINSLSFDINANNVFSEGDILMNYKNLKIDLLNKKKTDSLHVDKRGMFSMFANSIIRNSNPRHLGGFERPGEVYTERNVYKSVYNYWIAALVSGMKSTLGFKSKQFKERIKLVKLLEKSKRKSSKKKARKDKKEDKFQKKLIHKEIKQEQRLRRKSERKSKKDTRDEISACLFSDSKIKYLRISVI